MTTKKRVVFAGSVYVAIPATLPVTTWETAAAMHHPTPLVMSRTKMHDVPDGDLDANLLPCELRRPGLLDGRPNDDPSRPSCDAGVPSSGRDMMRSDMRYDRYERCHYQVSWPTHTVSQRKTPRMPQPPSHRQDD